MKCYTTTEMKMEKRRMGSKLEQPLGNLEIKHLKGFTEVVWCLFRIGDLKLIQWAKGKNDGWVPLEKVIKGKSEYSKKRVSVSTLFAIYLFLH